VALGSGRIFVDVFSLVAGNDTLSLMLLNDDSRLGWAGLEHGPGGELMHVGLSTPIVPGTC